MNHSTDRSEPAKATAVYVLQGNVWHPSELARGPWDPRAQHGGAPCALLTYVAEQALAVQTAAAPGWLLARQTFELIKPVPLAPLTTRTTVSMARSSARIGIDLLAGDTLVARAHALALRQSALALPSILPRGLAPPQLFPAPQDCTQRFHILGMPTGTSFHATSMEMWLAQGEMQEPGPRAAWFRLAVPMLHTIPTSPVMRVAAAADFGNGLSWVLSPKHYAFANADMSLHLHRPPEGEWIGLHSESLVHGDGIGTVLSHLYDTQGLLGCATQTLVLREQATPTST